MALTQLSALDASFVRLEEPGVHMHVTLVAFFAPDARRPPPSAESLRAAVAARLPLMPRFRQRMVQPPAGLGDPFWVDDPDFRLASHVESYTGAGEAMSLKSFRALTDALLSDPLDLRRPLWHLVLVPRLEDGRIGLIGRFHHAMLDGTSAMELGLVLFDASDAPPSEVEEEEEWAPAAVPGPARLAAATVLAQAGLLGRTAARVARTVRAPDAAASAGLTLLTRVSAAVRADVLAPAPPPIPTVPSVPPARRPRGPSPRPPSRPWTRRPLARPTTP